MEYYDKLETRDPAERERALMAQLREQVAHAKARSPYFAAALAKIDAREINSRASLAQLPVIHKGELIGLQKQQSPFGGLTATPLAQLGRLFASPGPIYDPEGRGEDWWRLGRALFAAGFRAGDLIHNTYAYHFSPGGFMLDGGARQLGCPVFPAGVGQADLQVATIARLRPVGYAGTPSFLRIILEKADEQGEDATSLKKALVSAEPLPPSLRALFEARGIHVRQCYVTADLGMIAYESEAMEGMILDEKVIVEIVDPGSGKSVAEGEAGEVVVTTLNPDYPLIRFGTGDLSAILPGASPCGRTNARIVGILGRSDQATKVRGMFVQPAQIAEVLRHHPEVGKARLTVDNPGGEDSMILHCEVAEGSEALKEAIIASMRNVTRLRGEVIFIEPHTLPNDGKVIDDLRRSEQAMPPNRGS